MMQEISQAMQISLAGIGSRDDFQAVLAETWRSSARDGSPLALILVEIDFFDPYQFACGLAASEKCLEAVADVLLETTSRARAQVFVDGPARFAVLIPGAAPRAAARLAEEIHFQVGGLVISHPRSPVSRSVSVSVGLSSQAATAEQASCELYDAAAAALAGARSRGRDRVIRREQLAAV